MTGKKSQGGLHHAGTIGQRDHPDVQPRLLRRQGDRQRRAQTHRNTEILVLDDGSTDGTRDLIEQSYADDGGCGISSTRTGASPRPATGGSPLCRGDFVALLDSDDTWSPWKLELQLACFRHHPEVGMVWSDMDAVNPGGEVVSRSYLRTLYGAYRWFPRKEDLFSQSFPLAEIAPGLAPVVENRRLYTGEIFSQMIMGNLVHTPTVLLRRDRLDKVGGFNEELRISGEDYDFHLRTCREGPVGFIDMATIRYQTGNPDQLTRSVPGSYRDELSENCSTMD